MIKELGLLDTFLVMVLPGCVGAYTLFVFRSFMLSLPTELMEAAYIDGAGEWRVWSTIVLPLSKPRSRHMRVYDCGPLESAWFNAMLYLKKLAGMKQFRLISYIMGVYRAGHGLCQRVSVVEHFGLALVAGHNFIFWIDQACGIHLVQPDHGILHALFFLQGAKYISLTVPVNRRVVASTRKGQN